MRLLIALIAFTAFGQMHPSPGPGRAAVGGGETTLTYLAAASNFGESSGTTLTTDTMSDVSAGDGIICVVYGQSSATITVADNGSNALTERHSGIVGNNKRWAWFSLASSASGNRTFTATWSEATAYRAILCYRVSYSGGTLTLAQQNSSFSSGSTTDITTGTITTTAKGLSVAACVGFNFGGDAPTSRQINATASTSVDHPWSLRTWYNLFESAYSNGQGTGSTTTAFWTAMITHWVVTP